MELPHAGAFSNRVWERREFLSFPPCAPVGQLAPTGATRKANHMSEIIFEVREDEVDGGYNAMALGYGIHTQGDTLEELRTMVKDAVDCYFDETMEAPRIIRLHFVRDEVLAR